ncbi:unknown [Bacteroides sp. CAG:754]|nr:unknown [Bacteroides sp. CAG:754]
MEHRLVSKSHLRLSTNYPASYNEHSHLPNRRKTMACQLGGYSIKR